MISGPSPVCHCGHAEKEHDHSRTAACLSFDTPNTMRCPCLGYQPIYSPTDWDFANSPYEYRG